MPQSQGSFGSVTAMSVLVMDGSRYREDGMHDAIYMLVGMCSRILVYEVTNGGRDDVVAATVAMPYGLRVHGIQWMSGSTPYHFYVLAYGGRCLAMFELVVSIDEGSSGCQIQHLVTDSSSCPAWILAGSLKPVPRNENGAFISVGMIHNVVSMFYFNAQEACLHKVCDFRGDARTMLYSMNIFNTITKEEGDDGMIRHQIRVAGGTMLWDILVWSGEVICQVVGGALIPIQETQPLMLDAPVNICGRHTGSIHCLTWNNYGSLLASGSDDRVVKVWDFGSQNDGTCVELYGSCGRIWSLCFSPDDKFLFSGSEDGFIYSWNLGAKRLHTKFRAHAYMGVRSITLHRFHLFSGGADGFVKVWDVFEHIPRDEHCYFHESFEPNYCFDLFRVSECFGTKNELEQSVAIREEVTQDIVPLSRIHGDVSKLMTLYGEIKRAARSAFETIKSLCLIFSGNIVLLATDKGRLLAIHLSHETKENCRRVHVLYSNTVSHSTPIVSMKSCELGDQTIVCCCDACGNLHLISLRQDETIPVIDAMYIVHRSDAKNKIIDSFIFVAWNQIFALAFSASGSLGFYKVSFKGDGSFDLDLLSTTMCPLRARITAMSISEGYLYSDTKAILVLGSARGGISIWVLDQQEGLTCVAAQMTAHDETPVQFVNAIRVHDSMYTIESGAMNFCIQNYVLHLETDAQPARLERKNEFRMDSLKVISDHIYLYEERKCFIGFSANQFIIWDADMDAEFWNVHSSGWRRPWAFHVDASSSRILFCHSSGNGDLHVYQKFLETVRRSTPYVLVSGGHGREVNSIVDLGHGIMVTAGADATLNLSKWHSINGIDILIPHCVSTQPFGTVTRLLRAIKRGNESIIVSGGAKTVMTVWKYSWDDSPRIQHVSTFMDPVVWKMGKSDKSTVDSRVLCFTLVPSLGCDSTLAFVVLALSNGVVEVRRIPSTVHNHRKVHMWPLIANLKPEAKITISPVLSLENTHGLVYAGNTNGDILIWNIESCLHGNTVSDPAVFDLYPEKSIYCVHSCGINALSLKRVSSRGVSKTFVISGGDDQALGILCLPESSSENPDRFILQNAHSSAIRDVCIYEDVIISIGLDQYMRLWDMDTFSHEIRVTEASSVHLQVLEPSSLSVSKALDGMESGKISITVAGRGIETYTL